jgi:hypothetical protein
MKLKHKAKKEGHSLPISFHRSETECTDSKGGTRISKISKVMAIAKTPSQKISNLEFTPVFFSIVV